MTDHSTPTTDTFVAHIIATLPDLDASITDVQFRAPHIVVTRGDSVSQVVFAPFERAYVRRPDALDAVVHTLLRVSQGEQGVPDPGYQALAPLIVPQLKPVVLLNDLLERGADPIIYRLLLADIMITYAILEHGRLSYITESQLEKWEVSEHTLHAQAIQNLADRSRNVPYHSAGEGDQRIIIFNHNDGLDAARILLPDMLATVVASLPGNPVIGIPNRDFMVIFSDEDPERVEAVALQVAQDVRQHDHGLTMQLFTFMDGEIREYHGL